MIQDYNCQVCNSNSLLRINKYSELMRVTSDCKPFKKGGELAVCNDCGAVQKLNSENWRSEIETIYAEYLPYHQSDGREQKVFNIVTGTENSRSNLIINKLKKYLNLESGTQILDFGCGNGVTLNEMSRIFTKSILNGFEISDKNLVKLNKINNFDTLYTLNVKKINRRFDLITMIHTLEHLINPKETLKILNKNNCKKYIFIEVSNIEENPFDLLIADHLLHFSPIILRKMMFESGFSIDVCDTSWVSREISMLCNNQKNKKIKNIESEVQISKSGEVIELISNYVEWFKLLEKKAKLIISDQKPFGIFGSSIAATWLASQLNNSITFFVDEDSSRINRKHLGIPIISVDSVPKDANVFIPQIPKIANEICLRLRSKPGNYVISPNI